jgi:hypothetical protein
VCVTAERVTRCRSNVYVARCASSARVRGELGSLKQKEC